MKFRPNSSFFFFITLIVVALLRASMGYASEMPLANCPPSVQATIRQELRNGHLEQVKHLSIEGRSLYIAEVELPGDRDLRIHVDSQGSLIKIREEIALEAAPQSVREAVAKLMPPNGHLDDVFRETAQGKITYRIEIDLTQARDLNLHLAEDGSLISRNDAP